MKVGKKGTKNKVSVKRKTKTGKAARGEKKEGQISVVVVPADDEEPNYDVTELSYVLSDAENLICDFEQLIDDDEVTEDAEDEFLSDMNCIRDRLEDFADDGWEFYRDTIEEYSNRLWNLGVAWPQYLPPWHTADIVAPDEIRNPIKDAWIYEDDFYAIRAMSDEEKMSFKAMVHELIKRGKRKRN